MVIGGIALLAAPFLVSSLWIDRRGIEVQGRVYAKSESVRMHYSSWTRTADVTVEYWPPDSGTIAYFQTTLDTAAYDAFHKEERVTVRYLQRRDLPDIPLAGALGQMRLLPVARLSGRSAFSPLQSLLTGTVRRALQWIAAGVVLLIVWRWAGWPGFKWAVAVCCLAAFAAVMLDEFPRVTPAPVTGVLQASGRVASIDEIDHFFGGNRTRGFDAAQPIQVVGVEFVPAGRSEPVLAVDLIDAGSIPTLASKSQIAIDYEAASPRTAHIHAATRTFLDRNLRGMAVQAGASLAVIVLLLAAANWVGGFWNRLLKR